MPELEIISIYSEKGLDCLAQATHSAAGSINQRHGLAFIYMYAIMPHDARSEASSMFVQLLA